MTTPATSAHVQPMVAPTIPAIHRTRGSRKGLAVPRVSNGAVLIAAPFDGGVRANARQVLDERRNGDLGKAGQRSQRDIPCSSRLHAGLALCGTPYRFKSPAVLSRVPDSSFRQGQKQVRATSPFQQ